MFGSKKNDEYTAVSEIVAVIAGRFGKRIRISKETEKHYRNNNRGADLLWENYRRYILANKNISMDMEVVFAGLDVHTAKAKLDSFVDELKTVRGVPFRILGTNKRYLVSYIPQKNMTKLKKILEKYEGSYDSWFDFDIYTMIKLPEAPKREMVTVPPLPPGSKIYKSMEAIVKAVNSFDTDEKLATLREELSKEQEAELDSAKEQAYWNCLLGAIEAQYVWLQDDFEAADVIEEIDTITNSNLGLDEDIDFSEFYVPEDVGTYKALSILAGELEEKGILLGLMESPDEKKGRIREDITVYMVLAVNNGDRNSLTKLFADCGGAIHFDFNDPKRLAAPVRQTGVLINWGGQRLPASDEVN